MKKESYLLSWYHPYTDALAGTIKFKSTPEKVRRWFSLPEDDPGIYCYDVLATQRKTLQKITGHDIDLNRYCYAVEGVKG